MDELADRAIKETDKAKRAKMYHDLQRMVLNGAPGAIPVGWVEGWFFTDKRVRGYKHSPTAYDNITLMKVWLAQ